jgi:hypothetical protein
MRELLKRFWSRRRTHEEHAVRRLPEAFIDIRLTLTQPRYWPKLATIIGHAAQADRGSIGIEILPRPNEVIVIGGASFEAADMRIWFAGNGIEERARNFALEAQANGFLLWNGHPQTGERRCDLIACRENGNDSSRLGIALLKKRSGLPDGLFDSQ